MIVKFIYESNYIYEIKRIDFDWRVKLWVIFPMSKRIPQSKSEKDLSCKMIFY